MQFSAALALVTALGTSTAPCTTETTPATADIVPKQSVPVASREIAPDIVRLQTAITDVARAASPSIVTVRSYVRNGSPAAAAIAGETTGWMLATPNQDHFGYQQRSAGSGFVVDAAGEILTCLHSLVLPDGSLPDLVDIETHDAHRILVDVIGTEPTVNLAILRCAVFPQGVDPVLQPLKFGDSDAMECGQLTFGLGDPAGPEKFFAMGTFITRPSRDCYQDTLSAFFLQTAMTVPPEVYGGPLLNARGEVIAVLAPVSSTPGVNATAPRYGIEYAMPSKIVEGLYRSIREVKTFRSPWLGFSVMSRAEIAAVRGVEAFNALSKPKNGILIENVFRPSPAADAGILPGDFLVGFDTYKVNTPVDFQRYMYLSGVGKTVKLELFRAGEVVRVELAITARPPEAVPR